MGNVLLVYATMSGNTEAMADLIEKGLIEAQASVDRYEAMDIHAELFNDYEYILLGTYTWGDGDLPDEMLDIAEDMENLEFTGKTFALFGSGDTSYEFFCGAVDELENIVRKKISSEKNKLKLMCITEYKRCARKKTFRLPDTASTKK